MMRPNLIAIVGGSGAGKSWLAERLQLALSPHAVRLSLDDFYLDHSHLTAARRARLNFDHPRAIDWPAFERVLRSLLANRPAPLPRYDFTTHCRLPAKGLLRPHPLILVDGLWLLRRPAIRNLFALRIFIDCPRSVRLARRLARDQQTRGRNETSIRDQFRLTVDPMHARFVAPQSRWADVLLHPNWGNLEIEHLAEALKAALPESALSS